MRPYLSLELERISKLPLIVAVNRYGLSFCKAYINGLIKPSDYFVSEC